MDTGLPVVGEPISETAPVAALGDTAMLKLTLWPWVIFTAFPLFNESVVAVEIPELQP
jgi:hypothetical protein